MNPLDLHPSRRALVKRLLFSVTLTPGVLALLERASANSQVPVIPGVQEMSGEVRINGVAARVGSLVKPGDTVTTGEDGSCVIIIGEHVYLIREDSEVEFYAEHFEEADNGSISGKIALKLGAMLSVFGETDTEITTPLATIGIRGTACYVDSRPERTYACVCYGRAELGSAMDGKFLETVTTTRHDSPRYIYPIDAEERIATAPVIDHTDAELRMLEALVNRRPKFDTLMNRGGGDGGY